MSPDTADVPWVGVGWGYNPLRATRLETTAFLLVENAQVYKVEIIQQVGGNFNGGTNSRKKPQHI